MKQKYFVEGVHRMSEDTFAVEIADTRYGYGDADRTNWLGVKAFPYVPGTYRVTGDLTGMSGRLFGDADVDNVAKAAVAEFVTKETAVALPINPDRKLEIGKVEDDEFVWVKVLTDRMIDGEREAVVLQFDWSSASPTKAPETDCDKEGPVDDDIRAFALKAANEARRERTLRMIERTKDRKEAKRAMEREAAHVAALEEKRVAKMAEDLGCTAALARYIDGLERRIEVLAGHAIRHYEDA